MDHVSWSLGFFLNPPLGGRPNITPTNHGTPNAHNPYFITFYHVWRPTWIEILRNTIWLRSRSYMTSHYSNLLLKYTTWTCAICAYLDGRCVLEGLGFPKSLVFHNNVKETKRKASQWASMLRNHQPQSQTQKNFKIYAKQRFTTCSIN